MKETHAPKMEVTFWGTRGSVSTPGRSTEKYGGNTPCISVNCNESLAIFDAGTGIRNLGLELEELFGDNGLPPLHLFLSHTHWDHIQGLPFFNPIYREGIRLTVYGSPKKEKFLDGVLKGQMDLEYFPVGLSELAIDLKIKELSTQVIDMGAIAVDWQEQVFHPGGSVRYRIRVGEKTVVYSTDVELDLLFAKDLDKKDRERYLLDLLDFIDSIDLWIADGQYTEAEYPSKMGWGHTSIPVLMKIAREAKVKQLAVFHHDPQHSDKVLDSEWKKWRRECENYDFPINVFWAREGMTVEV